MFHLAQFTDYGLLFLRVMAGLVFLDSGYADVKDPTARSKSIGLPRNLTLFLGGAEVLGGFAVIVGALAQPACIGLILVMLGALAKKMFVWKSGFWGKDGLGWNYELILISMLFVILCEDGGKFRLA